MILAVDAQKFGGHSRSLLVPTLALQIGADINDHNANGTNCRTELRRRAAKFLAPVGDFPRFVNVYSGAVLGAAIAKIINHLPSIG